MDIQMFIDRINDMKMNMYSLGLDGKKQFFMLSLLNIIRDLARNVELKEDKLVIDDENLSSKEE